MFGVENSTPRTCPFNLMLSACPPLVFNLDHAAGLNAEVESLPLMVLINTDRNYQKKIGKVYPGYW